MALPDWENVKRIQNDIKQSMEGLVRKEWGPGAQFANFDQT